MNLLENEVIQKIENQIKKSSILLKDYATKYDEAIRLVEDEKDFRLDFQRDSDRIIHSHSYTRYINKTQVYSNLEDDNISRRMTHVQFVSRAARTIARGLGLNENVVIEGFHKLLPGATVKPINSNDKQAIEAIKENEEDK